LVCRPPELPDENVAVEVVIFAPSGIVPLEYMATGDQFEAVVPAPPKPAGQLTMSEKFSE
jgi:hypothetical protein